MGLIVQKYGGTSVGSIERIFRVADRIIEYKKAGHDMVIVVSAMGKSTDVLVDMAKQISAYPSEREMDMLLATGEQVSIALLSMALHQRGYDAISLTALAGWCHNRSDPQQSADHGNQNRADSKGTGPGTCRHCGRVSRGQCRRRNNHIGTRRFRYFCRSACSRPECRQMRDLYGCGKRVYGRSAGRSVRAKAGQYLI